MRILLDTNVLVSGILIAGTPPARLLDLWRTGRFVLVTSRFQVAELRQVLARPRISRRLAPGEAEMLLDCIGDAAILVEELPALDVSPDPDDNLILATAIAGSAELIVSGDRNHVVALGSVRGIAIVTARQAVERLQRDDN